ncbi:MAG: hypothetical protein HY330_02385, partial [Chloroflexi bacterium]|nr:hypothetical protein [Chloroflexota bacterium]
AHLERVIDAKGRDYLRLQASKLYTTPPFLRSPERAKVPGGMMDYVVENVPNSIAITVELEPAISDPRGFVLPESEIQPTFELHRGAILTFLNCIGSLRTPPAARALPLQPAVDNKLAVFRSDCSQAFEGY